MDRYDEIDARRENTSEFNQEDLLFSRVMGSGRPDRIRAIFRGL